MGAERWVDGKNALELSVQSCALGVPLLLRVVILRSRSMIAILQILGAPPQREFWSHVRGIDGRVRPRPRSLPKVILEEISG